MALLNQQSPIISKKWTTTTSTIGSAHRAWNNKGKGTTMIPRRDSQSWEQKIGDTAQTIRAMMTILSTWGGRFLLIPTDGVKPKIVRITPSKRKAIMEVMTRSISTKGQLPPTKSKPTMTRTTMTI
jgi:hypothetical protein